ncbi:MAG: VWA domain-containing protein [Lysobacteraceae bacterium]|nr:MAG: VWA domain-containing protein [Xanthomonadaceae bacterium]
MLLALPLAWLLRWLLPPVSMARTPALRVPYGDRLAGIAGVGVARARVRGLGLLPWLAWCLLCLAAARPQQLGEVVQPPQAGRDLMLALDVSGSMEAPDMEIGGRVVQRLTAAKAVISDFLDRRRGDRIGLIVFGYRAYALTPLTRDLDTVREQLDATVVGLAGRETAIGDAIGLAAKRLQKQPAEQRVLILLTDGVNTAGTIDPVKAAELARTVGVRIHTIAFGGTANKLSVFGIPVTLPGGEPEIDEEMLGKVAQMTGGRSFRARDTNQLVGIYAEIERLEPVKRPGQRLRPKIEWFRWPLSLALACAVLAMWSRRRAAR